MGLVPEAKCRRCGKTFPAFRSACPYCGTRRVAQSTRAPGTTAGTHSGTAAYDRNANNMKWQLIFGMILVAAVILAVIVMVTTGVDSGSSSTVKHTAAPTPVAETQPTPESAPTPTPSPVPTVERVEIRYYETVKTEFTMKVGEKLPLNGVIYPLTVQGVSIKWSVADESIVKLTVQEDGKVEVECLQHVAGGTKIYAECCGVKAECQVYTSNG